MKNKNNIISEINLMKKMMGLNILNEGPGEEILTHLVSSVGRKELILAGRKFAETEIRNLIDMASLGAIKTVDDLRALKDLENIFKRSGKSILDVLADKINELSLAGKESEARYFAQQRKNIKISLDQPIPSSSTGTGSVTNPKPDNGLFAGIENEYNGKPIEEIKPTDYDGIIKELRKNPKFILYEAQIDLIPGLDNDGKKLLKIGYPKYANYTPSQLIEEMDKFKKVLQERNIRGWKKFGVIFTKLIKSSPSIAKWSVVSIASLSAAYFGLRTINWASGGIDTVLDFLEGLVDPFVGGNKSGGGKSGGGKSGGDNNNNNNNNNQGRDEKPKDEKPKDEKPEDKKGRFD
jgi:hypothetical protein